MKKNEKELQDILQVITTHADDAEGGLRTQYEPMSLDEWKMLLSNLETVHYFCMDARRIVRRRIKSAQATKLSTEAASVEITSESGQSS